MLERLTDFANKELLIKVNLNSNDTFFDSKNKIICVHYKETKTNKCFSLLHEFGHVIQPVSFFQVDNKNINICKTLILQQELNAWELGWLIAKYLGLDTELSKNDYIKESSLSIKSYIEMIYNADINYIRSSAVDYKINESDRLPEWVKMYELINLIKY